MAHPSDPHLFWLISVPPRKPSDDLFGELNAVCQKHGELSLGNCKFAIPSDLKVGNIDSLISLSDALKKVNLTVEQTLRKICVAYNDLQKDKAAQAATEAEKEKGNKDKEKSEANVKIKELTPNTAELTRFGWNQARFPVKKPLTELVQIIKTQFVTAEKELRERTITYNTLKAKLAQLEQSQSGSMMTRDLTKDLVEFKPVESEYLTTLYVVVPKGEQKNWFKTYETITQFVVPRSSEKISEDSEYYLNSVVVFQRSAEEFKTTARAKKFTVRKNDITAALSPEDAKNLQSEYHSTCLKFEKWAATNYTDGFSSWVHLKCVQCFVESILRYGLPPEFQAMVLTPKRNQERKLEKTLCNLYEYLGNTYDDKNEEEEKDEKTAALLGQEKFLPYVFLELDVSFGSKQN